MSTTQVMPLSTASDKPGAITEGEDDQSDLIQMEKMKVKYAKRETKNENTSPEDNLSEETPPLSTHLEREKQQRINCIDIKRNEKGNQGQEQRDDDALIENKILSDEDFVNPEEESIESLIENPSCSSEDFIDSSRAQIVTARTEEEDDVPELFSETNETLDPRKCDRLPPLGASSECSPQGILAGEFISAQREEAKNLLRSSTQR